MNYSAENIALWSPVVQLGIIALLVLVSNILRLKVPFVKKTLMPTSVLAGFLLLGFKYTGLLEINAGLRLALLQCRCVLQKTIFHRAGECVLP